MLRQNVVQYNGKKPLGSIYNFMFAAKTAAFPDPTYGYTLSSFPAWVAAFPTLGTLKKRRNGHISGYMAPIRKR